MLITSTRAWAIAARYGRACKRQCIPGAAAVLLAGCAANPPDRAAAIVSIQSRPFREDGFSGTELRTAHYRVLTTVRDAAVTERFVRVMEAAYAQYAALVPPTGAADRPLEIYFFATPAEWDAFTTRLTGPDAPVYLSVGPGGYAYGDRFVCWLFNASDLWGVAAHEGFHQYVARHLPLRLPPAVEEGLATTFESVRVTDQRVAIDRQQNPRRQEGLAAAVLANALVPLDQLVRLNAGDVAGRDLTVREGFYGQCWVLGRLLCETPAYADGLRRMLADLRDGRAKAVVGRTNEGTLYRPAAVGPLLAAYVSQDWAKFSADYAAAVQTFAGESPSDAR